MERNSKQYFKNLFTQMVSDGVNQIRLDNRIYRRNAAKRLYRVAGIRIEDRSRFRVPPYVIGTTVPLYKEGSRVYYEVPVVHFRNKKKRVYLGKAAKEALNEYTNGRL